MLLFFCFFLSVTEHSNGQVTHWHGAFQFSSILTGKLPTCLLRSRMSVFWALQLFFPSIFVVRLLTFNSSRRIVSLESAQ